LRGKGVLTEKPTTAQLAWAVFGFFYCGMKSTALLRWTVCNSSLFFLADSHFMYRVLAKLLGQAKASERACSAQPRSA